MDDDDQTNVRLETKTNRKLVSALPGTDITIVIGEGNDSKDFTYSHGFIANAIPHIGRTLSKVCRESISRRILFPNFSVLQWEAMDKFIVEGRYATLDINNVYLLLPLFHYFGLEKELNESDALISATSGSYRSREEIQGVITRSLDFLAKFGKFGLKRSNEGSWRLVDVLSRSHPEHVTMETCQKFVECLKWIDEKSATAFLDYIVPELYTLRFNMVEIAGNKLMPHLLMRAFVQMHAAREVRELGSCLTVGARTNFNLFTSRLCDVHGILCRENRTVRSDLPRVGI